MDIYISSRTHPWWTDKRDILVTMSSTRAKNNYRRYIRTLLNYY